MNYRVNVVFSKDENGYYAWCPELPGCQTEGDTYEEARTNIQEAIELYLETMTPDEVQDALGKEILTTTVEIAIA
ncbi:MAG: type II toxin-antitoxin system HicB family antitoxin [Segetibacter sp.]